MSRMYDESSVLEAARVAGDPTQGPEDGPCLYSSHPPVISEPKMRRKLVSGREPEVAAVTEALLAGPGARVLLHGPSGVGKATVATAVARQPVLCERALGVEAKANSMASGLRLRGWLPGATDDGLRRAVITLFLGALPSVIAGVEHKFDAALSCIKKWLQSNDWFIVVDEANWDCKALWDIFPTKGSGRLLVLSENTLHLAPKMGAVVPHPNGHFPRAPPQGATALHTTAAIELRPPSTADSLALIRATLEHRTDQTGQPALRAADAALLDEEVALVTAGPGPAVVREAAGALAAAGPPGRVAAFVEDSLGNWPVSTSLMAAMIGSHDSVATIDRFLDSVGPKGPNFVDELLIPAIRGGGIEVDASGGGAAGNYISFNEGCAGLTKLSIMAMDLISRKADRRSTERAYALLAVLCFMPSRGVPARFFNMTEDEIQKVLQIDAGSPGKSKPKVPANNEFPKREVGQIPKAECDTCYAKLSTAWPSMVGMFASPSPQPLRHALPMLELFRADDPALPKALKLLEQVGLVMPPDDADVGDTIGLMHPLVQHAVRDALRYVSGSKAASVSMHTLPTMRRILIHHMTIDCADASDYARLRLAAPLTERWVDLHLEHEHKGGPKSKDPVGLTLDGELLVRLCLIFRSVDCNPRHAVSMLERALRHRRRLVQGQSLTSEHPSTCAFSCALATTYHTLGRYADAAELHARTLEIRKRCLAPTNPRIYTSLVGLCRAYASMGKTVDVMKVQEEALAFQQRVFSPDDPRVTVSMGILASSYSMLGRHKDALMLQEKALELERRILPAGHVAIATSMNNLAMTYSDLGRHEEALKLREETLEIRKRAHPPGHPAVATAMGNLATSFSTLGRLGEAVALQEKVLKMQQKALPPEHPDIAGCMNNLAGSYSAQGRHKEAIALRETTVAMHKRVLSKDDPTVGSAMLGLAASYHATNRHKEAVALREEALGLWRRVLPPDHPDIGSAMNELGVSYGALGWNKQACELDQQALDFRQRVLPPDHPAIAISMNNLAGSLYKLANFVEAERYFKQALLLRLKTLPQGSPIIQTMQGNLRQCRAMMTAGADKQLMGTEVKVPKKSKRRTKPNEPCPCGSGKKFKKCCGKVSS